MIKFSIKANLNKVKDLLERSPEIFREEKQKALLEAGLLLEQEWSKRAPVGATGLYGKSIATQISGDRVTVGTPVEYGLPLEYGAKPHWAPLEALEMWGERKLGSAEAGRRVWYSISRKGMRPQLVATRALAASISRIQTILKSVGDRIAARFNSGG